MRILVILITIYLKGKDVIPVAEFIYHLLSEDVIWK